LLSHPPLLWKKPDERIFDTLGLRLRLDFGRRASCKHLPVAHRNQPVEEFRLLHVGSGYQHAHAGLARTHALDEFPELAAGEGSDAGCRLVEEQKLRVMNERAAQAELLADAA